MSGAEFTFKTPAVPEKIKNIRLDGYNNIFEFEPNPFPDPNHPNLWGTETLFGDWDGRLLIVLKDFSSTETLKNRPDERPLYSHAPKILTNRNLISFLNSTEFGFLTPRKNTICEMLYISACFLIRCGDGLSGRISSEALKRSWNAIEFSISKMRKLTDIALCGKEAFASFQKFGNLVADRNEVMACGRVVRWEFKNREFRVHLTCHPGGKGVNGRSDRTGQGRSGQEMTQEDWKRITKCTFGST
jgi:hypothetical protein